MKPFKKTSAKPAMKAAATPAPTPPATSPPTNLSDDQIQAIAQAFHDIAFQVSQVRLDAITAGAKLTDPLIVQLQGFAFSLLNTSSNFALQAANLTLSNADQAVAQITTATQTANKALTKLQDIDKAVKIASAVILLAMAISTKDLGQIGTASQAVLTAAGVKLPT
jgi:hypothetical protein